MHWSTAGCGVIMAAREGEHESVLASDWVWALALRPKLDAKRVQLRCGKADGNLHRAGLACASTETTCSTRAQMHSCSTKVPATERDVTS
jgi:hypothetical protein